MRRALNRFTSPGWRWLRDRFLDARHVIEQVPDLMGGADGTKRGLPIGSLTSQIWANVYLSPIDHCIASQIHIGTFVRYCDDITIFDDDRSRLIEALTTIGLRAEALRLRLHPTKTRLHKTTDPLGFSGL